MILLLLLISLSACVEAQPAAQLPQLLTNITDLQAEFSQSNYDRDGNLIEQQQGKVALARPYKLRWQVFNTDAQLINELVVNNNKIWHHDIELEQAMRQNLAQYNDSNMPITLLFCPKATIASQLANYQVTILDNTNCNAQTNSCWQLNNNEHELILGFHDNNITIISIIDDIGNKMLIKLINAQQNTDLAKNNSDLFEFTAPDNIDIIDETY